MLFVRVASSCCPQRLWERQDRRVSTSVESVRELFPTPQCFFCVLQRGYPPLNPLSLVCDVSNAASAGWTM